MSWSACLAFLSCFGRLVFFISVLIFLLIFVRFLCLSCLAFVLCVSFFSLPHPTPPSSNSPTSCLSPTLFLFCRPICVQCAQYPSDCCVTPHPHHPFDFVGSIFYVCCVCVQHFFVGFVPCFVLPCLSLMSEPISLVRVWWSSLSGVGSWLRRHVFISCMAHPLLFRHGLSIPHFYYFFVCASCHCDEGWFVSVSCTFFDCPCFICMCVWMFARVVSLSLPPLLLRTMGPRLLLFQNISRVTRPFLMILNFVHSLKVE